MPRTAFPCRSLFFLILCSISFLVSCRKDANEESGTPAVRVDVRTATVRSGDVEESVNATGTTMIRRAAQLRSPIAGILVRFPFFNGDTIRSGVTVAEIRSKESQAMIQGAEELLRTAETEQQREEARKAIDLGRRSGTTVQIRAPYDGVLSGKSKNEMEVVAEGDQLATVVDPSSIVFVADIPASRISKIHAGQKAGIRFANRPGKIYNGTVARIEPLVNPNDQTVKVNILFAGGSPVEGSLFGEASVTTGRHAGALLVPSAALLRNDENGSTQVVVVGADSIATIWSVEAGIEHDALVEVSSPALRAGMQVITEGHYGLPDSTHVRILR